MSSMSATFAAKAALMLMQPLSAAEETFFVARHVDASIVRRMIAVFMFVSIGGAREDIVVFGPECQLNCVLCWLVFFERLVAFGLWRFWQYYLCCLFDS